MSIPSYWRTRKQRLNLIGEICPQCQAHLFPPRDVCPHCGGPAKTTFPMSGRGQVYSFSQVHNAPAGFESAEPYVVALVKLDEGPMVTAQLTDVSPDEVAIGMRVEMVTRRLRTEGDEGLVHYGYKFRPVFQHMEAR